MQCQGVRVYGTANVRRTFRNSAAVIMAAIVLGCSGPAAGDGPEPADGGAAGDGTAGDGAADGRPLTDAERVVIDEAEELLVAECAEDAGFAYWPAPVASVDDRISARYVLDDRGWADRHGYGGRLQRAAERGRLADRNVAYQRELPERDRLRYDRVVDGDMGGDLLTVELPGGGGEVRTPKESCRTHAAERLYGDFPRWFRTRKTVEGLTALYVPELMRDRRFTRSLADWSACMRAAGHDHADPTAAREHVRAATADLPPEKAHAVEVEVAGAEARCADETGFAETARDLEVEYQEGMTDYRADIDAYRRMGVRALAVAREIVAEQAE